MRHEIISLKDLKGLYLLRRRFKKWRQNEWKNHVVYVYGPFDRVWAEKRPLRFSWIKEYMFIYLQTDYEMHWILRIFYRIFWISIFNTCSYGELFTGVSPIYVAASQRLSSHRRVHNKLSRCCTIRNVKYSSLWDNLGMSDIYIYIFFFFFFFWGGTIFEVYTKIKWKKTGFFFFFFFFWGGGNV